MISRRETHAECKGKGPRPIISLTRMPQSESWTTFEGSLLLLAMLLMLVCSYRLFGSGLVVLHILNQNLDHVCLDAALPDKMSTNPSEFKAACETHHVLRIDGEPQSA